MSRGGRPTAAGFNFFLLVMCLRTYEQLTIRDYGSHSRVAVCTVPSAHESTQLVGGDTEASPRGEEQEGGGHSRGVLVFA